MNEKNAHSVPVGDMILSVLKEAGAPVSTYELAKKIGISWSTANTHCYKLKDSGFLDSTVIIPKIGASKKVLWFLKGKK